MRFTVVEPFFSASTDGSGPANAEASATPETSESPVYAHAPWIGEPTDAELAKRYAGNPEPVSTVRQGTDLHLRYPSE